MSEPIAIIPKNNIDEIRIIWSEYKGHVTWTSGSTPRSRARPTKVRTMKAVTLRPDLIPELMKALESAQRDPAHRPSPPHSHDGPTPPGPVEDDYVRAADEMLASRWARRVGGRDKELGG
jgi:hypothetical protein